MLGTFGTRNYQNIHLCVPAEGEAIQCIAAHESPESQVYPRTRKFVMCADCHARQAGIREAAAAAAREKARELARVASAERAEETARARRQHPLHGFPRIESHPCHASSRDYTARACKMQNAWDRSRACANA